MITFLDLAQIFFLCYARCALNPRLAFCYLIRESSSVWKRSKTSFFRHLTGTFFPNSLHRLFTLPVLWLYWFCSIRSRSFFYFRCYFFCGDFCVRFLHWRFCRVDYINLNRFSVRLFFLKKKLKSHCNSCHLYKSRLVKLCWAMTAYTVASKPWGNEMLEMEEMEAVSRHNQVTQPFLSWKKARRGCPIARRVRRHCWIFVFPDKRQPYFIQLRLRFAQKWFQNAIVSSWDLWACQCVQSFRDTKFEG